MSVAVAALSPSYASWNSVAPSAANTTSSPLKALNERVRKVWHNFTEMVTSADGMKAVLKLSIASVAALGAIPSVILSSSWHAASKGMSQAAKVLAAFSFEKQKQVVTGECFRQPFVKGVITGLKAFAGTCELTLWFGARGVHFAQCAMNIGRYSCIQALKGLTLGTLKSVAVITFSVLEIAEAGRTIMKNRLSGENLQKSLFSVVAAAGKIGIITAAMCSLPTTAGLIVLTLAQTIAAVGKKYISTKQDIARAA